MFRFLPDQWGGVTRDRFLEAMRAEGIPVSAGYPVPLYKNPMFLRQAAGPAGCPVSCPYYAGQVDYAALCAPHTERLCAEMVWLMQTALLADEQAMRDVARAAQKIWDHREELLEIE
jgi:dTDP-4-amino-4,6-dideoxygalactose transaminase